MRQVLLGRGMITVGKVPAPVIAPGCVLVETAYSLISAGTEIGNIERAGKPLLKYAIERPQQVHQLLQYLQNHGVQKTFARVRSQLGAKALGYSCSGTVIQVATDVQGLYPGDRVACAGGNKAIHAELVLVPRNLVVKVPDGCDPREAASVALGAIAMQGVRRADLKLGEICVVIGLGLLGQLTAQMLRAAGCRVIGIDLDGRRVSVARQLGIDHAYSPGANDVNTEVLHATAGRGADATIITASSPANAIVQQAIELTRKKGRVVVVGDVGLGLERSPFYEKELDFLISCSYGPGRYDERYEESGEDYPYPYVRWTENRNMAEYLRLVATHSVSVGPLLEREYALPEAAQAYADLTGQDKPIGVVLRYHAAQEPKRPTSQENTARLMLHPTQEGQRIRTAVVGAGAFATSTHLPNLHALARDFQIRAVVDTSGTNASSVAEQYKADYASTAYADVLADPEVDAVIICTRHNQHAKQVLAALKAGKHVYCEKPLVLNGAELDEILAFYGLTSADLAGKAQSLETLRPLLMVGFNRRYSPAAREIQKVLSTRHDAMMMLYRVNAGFIESENWVQGPEGGGRILGEMCHMIDLLNFWAGCRVASVSVDAILPQSGHSPRTDNLTATMTYEDGSLATLMYSALGSPEMGKEFVEVYVDGKTLVLDDFKRLSGYGVRGFGWKGARTDKGHAGALECFARSIKCGRWITPLSDIEHSSQVTLTVSRLVAEGTGIGLSETVDHAPADTNPHTA